MLNTKRLYCLFLSKSFPNVGNYLHSQDTLTTLTLGLLQERLHIQLTSPFHTPDVAGVRICVLTSVNSAVRNISFLPENGGLALIYADRMTQGL